MQNVSSGHNGTKLGMNNVKITGKALTYGN